MDVIKSQDGRFFVMDPCYVKDSGQPYNGEYELVTGWGPGEYPFRQVIGDSGEVVGFRLAKTEADLDKIAIFAVTDCGSLGVDSGIIAFMDSSVFPLPETWNDNDAPGSFADTFYEAPLSGTVLGGRVAYCSPGDGSYALFRDVYQTVYEISFDYYNDDDDYDDEEDEDNFIDSGDIYEDNRDLYEEGLDILQGVS